MPCGQEMDRAYSIAGAYMRQTAEKTKSTSNSNTNNNNNTKIYNAHIVKINYESKAQM